MHHIQQIMFIVLSIWGNLLILMEIIELQMLQIYDINRCIWCFVFLNKLCICHSSLLVSKDDIISKERKEKQITFCLGDRAVEIAYPSTIDI